MALRRQIDVPARPGRGGGDEKDVLPEYERSGVFVEMVEDFAHRRTNGSRERGRAHRRTWPSIDLLRTMHDMERRTRRSSDCYEAIQYLVEALAERSNVSTVVLTADNGSIVAGTGEADEIGELASIAGPLLRGEPCETSSA